MRAHVVSAGVAVVCCTVVAVGCADADIDGGVVAAVSARPSATVVPIGTFPVAQYQPGSELWPPRSPIGPQVVPPWQADSTPTSSSSSSSAAATATTTVATSPPSTVAAVGFHPADAETAAAVTAAVGKAEAAFVAAMRDTSDPTLRQAIASATVPGSQAEALYVGGYDTLAVEQRLWAVAPADGENSVTVVEGDPGVLVDSTGTVALVTVCYINGDTVMGRDDTGSSVVVDPGWIAVLQVHGFQLVDGSWRLLQVTNLGELEGARSCDEVPPSSSASSSS